MIKDDYSSKISEEFLSLIKQIKDVESLRLEALNLIGTAFKRFLGFSSSFVNSVSEEDLLNLMKKNDKIQGIQCAIAATLLFEEGNIFYKEKKYNESYFRYLKSLNLISTIFILDLECELEGYKSIAKEIGESIEKFEIGEKEQEKLFHLYKSLGIYSKAEDHLYELINSYTKSDFTEKTLEAFYNELLKKSDDELIEGNLPRNEILEALETSKFNN